MSTPGHDDWTEEPLCICSAGLIGYRAGCPKHDPHAFNFFVKKESRDSEDYAFLLANVRDAVGEDE